MARKNLNWSQLLRRVEEHSALLDQLEGVIDTHALTFAGFGAVLLECGFTVPETQELYTLLL